MPAADAWVMIPKVDNTGCVIDMRPLVLCKDCKYWSDKTILEYHKCTRWNNQVKNFATAPIWFCADGERKDTDA